LKDAFPEIWPFDFFQNVSHLGFDPPENGTIGFVYLKNHILKET